MWSTSVLLAIIAALVVRAHAAAVLLAAAGVITTVAGTGRFGFSGDGGPATRNRRCPWISCWTRISRSSP